MQIIFRKLRSLRNQSRFAGFLGQRSSKDDVDVVQGRCQPQLLMEAKQIAWEFLERSGEIDDPGEINQFLTGKIEHMIGQGQRNRLALSNRAIAAFREYRRARTIELTLVSR